MNQYPIVTVWCCLNFFLGAFSLCSFVGFSSFFFFLEKVTLQILIFSTKLKRVKMFCHIFLFSGKIHHFFQSGKNPNSWKKGVELCKIQHFYWSRHQIRYVNLCKLGNWSSIPRISQFTKRSEIFFPNFFFFSFFWKNHFSGPFGKSLFPEKRKIHKRTLGLLWCDISSRINTMPNLRIFVQHRVWCNRIAKVTKQHMA